ncbi:MAG: protein kinase domain-containing protein [Acidobacteriota bacterium]
MSESAARWGRYTAVSLLRKGSWGLEYDAVDGGDGRRVVLVVAPATGGHDDQSTNERFLARARAAVALDHPKIVPVREVGTDPATGRPFFVSDHPAGRTLDQLVREGVTLSPLEVAGIGATVAEVLAHAHRHGVIHEHLTPDDLVMGTSGTVSVGGFALLATPPGSPGSNDAFLAPEQLRGEPASWRSDLFSLGAILYQLATGSQPMEQPGLAGRGGAPAPPSQLRPDLPPALGAAIFRMIQKDPDKRPGSASEVSRFLEGVKRGLLGGQVTDAARASGAARTSDRRTGVRVAVALGAVGFLALVALLALLPRSSRTPARAPIEVGVPAAGRAEVGEIEAALASDDVVTARRLLAELARDQGDSPVTAALRKRVEDRAGELADRLLARGIAAMGEKRWDEAAEILRAVLVLRPEQADASRYLGEIRDRQLADLRASSFVASERPSRPRTTVSRPTLGLYFDSPLPAGRIELTLDGSILASERFDFARDAFMGLARRSSGLIRRSWPIAVGDHRLTVALSDSSGRLLREESFTLTIRPDQGFLIRIEMRDPAATPTFILAASRPGNA